MTTKRAAIQVDGELAIKHLIALAEEKPDYKYQSPTGVCVYWTYSDEEEETQRIPSCIVGYVLDKLGVLDQIPESNVGTFLHRLSIDFSDDPKTNQAIIDILDEAQEEQDMGVRWGVAVQIALKGTKWEI